MPLPTTGADFFEKGTQPVEGKQTHPWTITDELETAQNGCYACHLGFDAGGDPATTTRPYRWRGSAHAHSARDPIFRAAFAVAQADAPGSGELCLRCHAPAAWLSGRVTPPSGSPDGSALLPSDIDEGIQCIVCHRMADPVYEAGVSPADDEMILAALDMYPGGSVRPTDFGNGKMVIDPADVRRGPFADASPPHGFAYSPHHRTGDMCGTCHEVSNPALSRVGGPVPAPTDTYVVNPFNMPHPTDNKTDMFPEQRTYSEWQNSAFPAGVDMQGRFGGNRTVVSSCQDCHMPAVTGTGCWEIFEPPVRNDMPYHSFQGANLHLIEMLLHLHGPTGDNTFDSLTLTMLDRQKVDTQQMLSAATDAELSQTAGELNVRVVNQCGHKLLTGMPEGRRIWINVKFFSGQALIDERGEYDVSSAVLAEGETKIYEQLLGIDDYMSGATGKPVGPSFHLVLVNKIFKDNRIPPRGFTNAAFNAAQAGHFGYSYADGQHWDDTRYCVPAGATRAEVKVYYQNGSRDYMEFLRDNGGPEGQTAYDAWVAIGKSVPIVMDDVSIDLAPFARGDVSGDGVTSFNDITRVLSGWGASGGGFASGDANCDGLVNFADITTVLTYWGESVR
ncbi:MAG: multiheme c-type cytochrome [Planctomycetota bacterium]|nr:multiheme c-type cytochrome [Planctomycetota bacterium]